MNLILLAAMLQPLTDARIETAPWVASRVDIVGQGWTSTDVMGPAVHFVGTGDGFVLGAGDPFRATGGRLERLKIVRKGSGGTAIKMVATSIAERPGQYTLRDLLILGDSDLHNSTTVDNWDCGILIDGGSLNKVNEAGIRCVRMDNVRIAGCLGDSLVLRNVLHFNGSAIQVDPGSSKRVPNVLIENSQHVVFGGNIFGELHVRGSKIVRIDGYVQTLRIDRNCSDVVVTGSVGKLAVDFRARRINTAAVEVVK